MKADVILELESGKGFTEAEALCKLLEISSQEFKEGKVLTAEEVMNKVKEKLIDKTKRL